MMKDLPCTYLPASERSPDNKGKAVVINKGLNFATVFARKIHSFQRVTAPFTIHVPLYVHPHAHQSPPDSRWLLTAAVEMHTDPGTAYMRVCPESNKPFADRCHACGNRVMRRADAYAPHQPAASQGTIMSPPYIRLRRSSKESWLGVAVRGGG